MCGMFVTPQRMQAFDFTSPFYMATGLRAAVKLSARQPSGEFLMRQWAFCVDGQALLILIFLLIAVIVFGHFVSAIDIAFHARPIFRKSYFEAVQDGIWMAFVMLTTIGFGDIVPRSLGGRLLAVVWMFFSISMNTIIYGIVTTNFGAIDLTTLTDLERIRSPEDLSRFTVGTTFHPSSPELRGRLLSPSLQLFDSSPQLFQALLNGTIDVAVDRSELVTYYSVLDPAFSGAVLPVGAAFNLDGAGFGVARGAGDPPADHPLLGLLSLAVADATRTAWQTDAAARGRWFGLDRPAPAPAAPDDELIAAAYETVMAVLKYVLAGTAGVWVVFAAAEILARYPAYKARNDVCAAVRHELGLPPHAGAADRALAPSARRDGIRAGLARIQQEEEARLCGAGADGPRGSAAGGGASAAAADRDSDGSRAEADSEVDLNAFAGRVAATLAREQWKWRSAVLRSSGRLVCGPGWELLSVWYSRRGLAIAQAHLAASYEAAVGDGAGGGGEAPPRCAAAAAAVAVEHLLGREEGGWFRPGGLLFPGGGGGDEDRNRNQLLLRAWAILDKKRAIVAGLSPPGRRVARGGGGGGGPARPATVGGGLNGVAGAAGGSRPAAAAAAAGIMARAAQTDKTASWTADGKELRPVRVISYSGAPRDQPTATGIPGQARSLGPLGGGSSNEGGGSPGGPSGVGGGGDASASASAPDPIWAVFAVAPPTLLSSPPASGARGFRYSLQLPNSPADRAAGGAGPPGGAGAGPGTGELDGPSPRGRWADKERLPVAGAAAVAGGSGSRRLLYGEE